TVIIMTSNVGAQYIDQMQSIGFSKGVEETYGDMKEKVMTALREGFRPEFLNRLDDIIVFDVLSKETIKSIVSIQVDIVKKRLAEKEIDLIINDSVFELLAEEGYNPQYGARPIKRLIQTKILNPVATMMISNKVFSGESVVVDRNDKEVTFEVKKEKSTNLSKIKSTQNKVLK
ncbi:MAG: AAA family ATPase, partial [bacterium]|nr:AAA family ATPase [bacterium]